MVRNSLPVLAGVLALLAPAAPAAAADLGALPEATAAEAAANYDWFIHVGPAGVFFSESAKVKAGGTRVSGGIDIDPDLALALDIGYYVTPDISVSLTLANPPLAAIDGDGGVVGTLGTIGKTHYLPPVLAAQYHLPAVGPVRPYIGAGVNYTMFFNEKDGALTNFKVDNAFGAVLQAGAEVMLSDRLGMFVDVKHIWLSTEATGRLGPTPVKADVTLDPTVVTAGLAYRF